MSLGLAEVRGSKSRTNVRRSFERSRVPLWETESPIPVAPGSAPRNHTGWGRQAQRVGAGDGTYPVPEIVPHVTAACRDNTARG